MVSTSVKFSVLTLICENELTDKKHLLLNSCYCTEVSSVIRRSFFFQNNPKDLDPSYKTDLDLLDCLGRVNLVL